MMTTGYDCEDILNLCMMRPIFSPTDFIQIKGRGTRKYAFTFKEKNEIGEPDIYSADKKAFKLFDFFANCEYFEEKFDYDEVLKLPQGVYTCPESGETITPNRIKDYENFDIDPLMSYIETTVGLEGMKIDRKFFEKFEDAVKSDRFVLEKMAQGTIEEAEEYIRNDIFDKPEEYFNLEKLRKSVKLDRRLSLREILEFIFGKIKKFKTKDELLEEEVEKFISIYRPESKFVYTIRAFVKAYISDNEIRDIMETREYQRLATNPRFSMSDLKELGGWMNPVIEYIKDYVPLNAFV